MKKYKATADVLAQPMTSDEASCKGYLKPWESRPCTEGYHLMYYSDSKRYKSWMSKFIFEALFSPADTPKQRMEIEYNQLSERINSLENFLSRKDANRIVGVYQMSLLERQYAAMKSYSHSLWNRMVEMLKKRKK